MVVRRPLEERIFGFFNIAMLTLLMVATVYPFLHVFAASLSDPLLLTRHRGLIIWPLGHPTLASYARVFENPNILQSYYNTIIYVTFGTSLSIFLTALGAYGLSRKRIAVRGAFMVAITFTLLFDGGLIPRFLLIKSLGMLDTRLAIIIPTIISTWNLIIMRTSFGEIPESMEESARIDGAGDFAILFRIILPLSLPVVAVMLLFYGVRAWNAWFNAMIFLRDRSLYPLQLILREILIENDTSSMTLGSSDSDREAVGASVKYATVMVATLPVMTIYPMMQKYFVKGVMVGAIKG